MNNELDSCLSELDNILNSLMTSNFYLQYFIVYGPKLNIEVDKTIFVDNVQPIRDILLDNMIMQLDKLDELQPQLGKCLKDIGKENLIKVLKEFWLIIVQNRKKINEWRNKIVAHSKEQSKNYVSYHKLDPEYSETIQNILFASRYAVTYIWGLLRNINEEFAQITEKKYQELNEVKKEDSVELLAKIIHQEKDFFSKMNDKLTNSGYEPAIFCGYDKWPMNNVSSSKQV